MKMLKKKKIFEAVVGGDEDFNSGSFVIILICFNSQKSSGSLIKDKPILPEL
jgi:hypothetical protein